jgi:nitroreductase
VAGRSSPALALQLLHRRLEHGRVQLEADGLDVAALLAAEHVARAAQLQVERGDFKSRAEVAELLERGETAAGDFSQFILRRDEQVGIRAAIGAAHAATQLVELAQAVTLSAVDQDGIREWNVEAVLDDGCGDEHVELVTHEGEHDFFEIVLAHLAVRHGHARRGTSS